ncbi:leucine-rich repeat-containing protein 74A-like isoform X1 [Mizuhopecten yessoensis]|uniref:leucine-rich repeat-containing protein 74A-like isoform X1 n=1 Tax=Mizuhopecten yessoensis TaxID=6573 RepID=UPI000B45D13D|nr:leucine-rich repeat-containing protein 74A-like isoform X1 [Mizuhopecten yessoensis]
MERLVGSPRPASSASKIQRRETPRERIPNPREEPKTSSRAVSPVQSLAATDLGSELELITSALEPTMEAVNVDIEDGEGWDTDLEDVKNLIEKAKPKKHENYPKRKILTEEEKARLVYIRACIKFSITPSSLFLRGLKKGHVNLQNQGLGPLGTQAVALSLVIDRTVTDVVIAGNSIGQTGIRYLTDMLLVNDNINHIDVSDNNLQSHGAQALSNMLLHNDSILSLKASGNQFNRNDALLFAQAIQFDRFSLRVLDLSHNNLETEGGQHLGPAIAANDTIEILDISWNHLAYDGIKAVAEGLKENTSIKTLNVSWNGIGDEGAVCLVQAATINETLEVLQMDANRIGPIGLANLLKQTASNKALLELKMSKNPITTLGPESALHVINAHPEMGLQLLEIQDSWLTSEACRLVYEIQELKPKFKVVHGGFTNAHDLIKASIKKREENCMNDPFLFLINYVNDNRLRWMDLFNRLDTDKNFSISFEEFRNGMKANSIPISDKDVGILMERLDEDHDGTIDFGELLEGQKKYLKRFEKVMGVTPTLSTSTPSTRQNSRPSSRQQSRPSSRQKSRPSSRQQSRPTSRTDRSAALASQQKSKSDMESYTRTIQSAPGLSVIS